jgi:hypothetical protein
LAIAKCGNLALVATLLWMPQADQTMIRLENDPTMDRVIAAIYRVLGHLEIDPKDSHLGTRTFTTPNYGYVRTTPARHDDWHIFWTPGVGDDEVVIIDIAETSPR